MTKINDEPLGDSALSIQQARAPKLEFQAQVTTAQRLAAQVLRVLTNELVGKSVKLALLTSLESQLALVREALLTSV